MKPFRFPLEKVLVWRRKQLELEEIRMKQLSDTLEQLERSRAALRQERRDAERDVRQSPAIAAQDLAAFAAYRVHLERREQKLAQARRQAEQHLTEQRARVLVRNREAQLVVKLRARRHAEWQAAVNLELANAASEAHLSRRHRDLP